MLRLFIKYQSLSGKLISHIPGGDRGLGVLWRPVCREIFLLAVIAWVIFIPLQKKFVIS